MTLEASVVSEVSRNGHLRSMPRRTTVAGMANKVNRFPAGHWNYPWEDWEDGSIWEIHAGDDFSIPTRSMSATLYQQATRHGKRVKVAVRNDTITFQFSDRENGANPDWVAPVAVVKAWQR